MKYGLEDLSKLKLECDLVGMDYDGEQVNTILDMLGERASYFDRLLHMVHHYVDEKWTCSVMMGAFLRHIADQMGKECLEEE